MSRSGHEDRPRETVSQGWLGIVGGCATCPCNPVTLCLVNMSHVCGHEIGQQTGGDPYEKHGYPPPAGPPAFASEPKLHPASSGSYPISSTLLSPANSLRITSTLADWRSC